MLVLTMVVIGLLTFAPMAFARDDGGEGWYGETTDKEITTVMFITIAFFPTVILIFTLIQRRPLGQAQAARRARCGQGPLEASADWRGGGW